MKHFKRKPLTPTVLDVAALKFTEYVRELRSSFSSYWMGKTCSRCCCCHETNDVRPVQPETARVQTAQPTTRSIPIRRTKEKFVALGIHSTNPSDLIKGYEKERLHSFEKAVDSLNDQIFDLDNKVRRALKESHLNLKYGLTHDESAAIYFFTMPTDPKATHEIFNEAILSKDPNVIRPWFPYMKLIQSAKRKLPTVQIEAWRTILSNPQLESMQIDTKNKYYTSLIPCSSNKSASERRLNGKHGKWKISSSTINVKCSDISEFSGDKTFDMLTEIGMPLHGMKMTETNQRAILYFLCNSGNQWEKMSLTSPTPTLNTDSIVVDHWVCRSSNCSNRCQGDHAFHHCKGHTTLHHSCSHHCGPVNFCDCCKQAKKNLILCRKCGHVYCDDPNCKPAKNF